MAVNACDKDGSKAPLGTTMEVASDTASGDAIDCEDVGGGYESCAGSLRRVELASCTATESLPVCSLPAGSELVGDCASDSDCSEGSTCYQSDVDVCVCERLCLTDADCPADSICLCGAATGGRNLCIAAGCRSAADCGGEPCRVSKDGCGFYGSAARTACSTPDDACHADADCEGVGEACLAEAEAWACVSAICG